MAIIGTHISYDGNWSIVHIKACKTCSAAEQLATVKVNLLSLEVATNIKHK